MRYDQCYSDYGYYMDGKISFALSLAFEILPCDPVKLQDEESTDKESNAKEYDFDHFLLSNAKEYQAGAQPRS